MSARRDYRPSAQETSADVAAILAIRDPAEKFAKLRASADPQAQFLWAMFRDLFHYTAYHLADIADTARDVDFAIRWGYGWKLGPFETWQAAGWQNVAKWIAEDIAAGKAMSDAPLPALGHRRPSRRPSRRGLVLAEERQGRAALVGAGLQAPALPRSADRREVRHRHDASGKTTACASGTSATTSASSRSRPR